MESVFSFTRSRTSSCCWPVSGLHPSEHEEGNRGEKSSKVDDDARHVSVIGAYRRQDRSAARP